MPKYRPGDKSQAICYDCADLVSTVFEIRDVPFDDGSGIAEGVLAAICERCGAVVAVPGQEDQLNKK